MKEKLHILALIAEKLNEAGIVWCLAASGLLYFNGLISEFRDLDVLVTDTDADRAAEILSGIAQALPTRNTTYHEEGFLEYVIEGMELDLISDFVIASGGRDYNCTLEPKQIICSARAENQIVPLQSLSRWKTYYRLMGRTERAELLRDYTEMPLSSLKQL